MKNFLRQIGCFCVSLIIFVTFNSCNKNNSSGDISNKEIAVISREEGSGTRGAFIELFGIEQKTSEGKKFDNTVDTSDITNSTEVMITSVSGNLAAIGYISLGSLNTSVKALMVDGAAPTAANIKNGTYTVSRPFNIVTRPQGVSEAAADFIRYILSSEGQTVAEKNGYISVVQNPAYLSTGKKGKITIAGSSSVTPLMEKLAEDYMDRNPGINIEVQMSDSTTGINSAVNGICDIGMASRSLTDSEKGKGIISTVIAKDGIAIIVNSENPLTNISYEAVRDIYTGKTTLWGQLK